MTGITYGNLDGNTKSGNGDIFLVKYDSSGIKQSHPPLKQTPTKNNTT